MNREEVIRMAREAEIIDFRDASDDPHVAQMVEFLERFAALVAAAEREACAQTAERMARLTAAGMDMEIQDACAAAIRARGSQ